MYLPSLLALKRWLQSLLLVGLSLSGQAFADSYVFITNSTPETVQINVAQTGSSRLTAGSQWQQEATEIAPYATARVLAFNRNVGVKNGKTYQFDTQITAGGSTIVARQQMTGNWVGSSIKHSITTTANQAPWFTDRNIHRYQAPYQNRLSTQAVAAQYTGGYDDFYYTISNLPPQEPLAGADSLKVLTYNIYALPLVASDIATRLTELPAALKGYDVLFLQEAFSADSPALLRALAAEYPYQTEILRAPLSGINVYNGGVVIASRYPLGEISYLVYPDCTGTDCFADKGFIYAEVIKHGKGYHVVNTHAASFDSDAARQMRQAQFKLMQQHIAAKPIPVTDAVIYGGDFNVNKLRFADDYSQMQANLAAAVPAISGYSAATFDPRVNHYAASYDTVEYLDYLVYSTAHKQPRYAVNDVRVFRSTGDALWRKWDLSDHFAVLAEFRFD
ncbi:MAG: sphingomyelin phosphodiesterase [Gammaproteobacteria bacterium]|nr:sphingomyelin phosphodiesterase [Gammaproteobacteria bacterium]MBU1554520.1 sphingomyelin phosphodiesterase [Gammaproteobacteria bacterium]MBU2071024.1 sphingomyelin phosphodiesterase [Gammaproteobacteria bacterium]MBU2184292.1 sphingomyelin phosphodiesterase [Gammaproteobacteria bacterium]MBU2206451.1 sphingomyelin phosphodiesterase [Gammaproteobacteria bacterium]